MVFNTANAPDCEGCTQPGVLTPITVTLFSQTASPVILIGPDKQDYWCAGVNIGFLVCIVDAVRPATWGTIKTLYR